MNKLNTMYSNIEFQHKRFRLLNGEIISKMPLSKIYSNIYCLRKFQNDQVISVISYAKYKSIHGFWKDLHFPGRFHWFPEPTHNFYRHGKENSRKIWTFSKVQEPSMTMHFFISRCLVILLEKSYNQINTLFTSTYLPSISPISGSTETK